ncbi:hypothetical protein [Pseudalkalibacillus hwajinpoensis]|uniref:hypothetical protein n=1 Tax=Guptibacillus hwajinpoensis TaxID=208199 RepID=UPI001CFEB77F|nr:hypothetical protein [Pseudalkalibacillus hwajinpoensis]
MKIIDVTYEHLEKERSNSPEDSFVRSTVTYIHDGNEKKFHVLYPAIFSETAEAKGIWEYEVPLHEAIALNLLSSYPGRKRLYINSEDDFFSTLEKTNIPELYTTILNIKKHNDE